MEMDAKFIKGNFATPSGMMQSGRDSTDYD